MENPETLATLGTHDTGRRQTKQKTHHRKLKRWATPTPSNMWPRRVGSSCLL